MCHLPARHDGDHACISEDDAGEPHETCPRAGIPGWPGGGLYQLDLIRYADGDFCDLCGPVDVTAYANSLLDHPMREHPELWVAEGLDKYFSDYLGDGRWRDPETLRA
jgi:hypothetical protein